MRITVIGEKCDDIFIYGETKRLSPEAPVPVFIPLHTETNMGMAGNVMSNITSLTPKSRVSLISQIKKITKTRYVEEKSNHMFLRVDEGENDIDTFNLNVSTTNLIKNSDIVIVSDYNKGFLDDDTLLEIGKISKLSILDSKKKLTNDIIDSFTFIKMNESEYSQNSHLNSTNIITTLGSKGCMYRDEIFESPSPKETIDVSGAGDTFTASFILKYQETNDVKNSLVYANEMASIVVSKRGVATP